MAQGYEHRDVKIGGVVKFGIGLAVATALSMFLMWTLLDYFNSQAERHDAGVVPATRVATESPAGPPSPRLQGAPGSEFELQNPVVEMEAMRGEEEAALSSWGWVDRSAGLVHMPVERAKELIVEQGLPARTEEEAR